MTGITEIPGALTVSAALSTAFCGRSIPDPKNKVSAIRIFIEDTEEVSPR
jgi:hypothetical protein